MNKKIILIATISMLSLSACRADETETTPSPSPAVEVSTAPMETTKPTPTASVAPETSEEPMPSEEPNPMDLAPEFTLTEEETVIYNEYIKEQDVTIFKDVNQISIAKIFIKCGIDGNFEAEFKMYAPSTLGGVTYDQYIANETANGAEGSNDVRQNAANYFFSSMDTGTFVDSGDGTGYIATKTFEDTEIMFNMVKTEEGIWLIDFQNVMNEV